MNGPKKLVAQLEKRCAKGFGKSIKLNKEISINKKEGSGIWDVGSGIWDLGSGM